MTILEEDILYIMETGKGNTWHCDPEAINIAKLSIEIIDKLNTNLEIAIKALEFINASDSAICSSEKARKALKKIENNNEQ